MPRSTRVLNLSTPFCSDDEEEEEILDYLRTTGLGDALNFEEIEEKEDTETVLTDTSDIDVSFDQYLRLSTGIELEPEYKTEQQFEKAKIRAPAFLRGRIQALKIFKMRQSAIDLHFKSVIVDDILDNCRTGDVLLFRSTSRFGRMIQVASLSNWSHAMVLVVDPPDIVKDHMVYEEHRGYRVFVLEMISGETWKGERNNGGIQFIPLKCYVNRWATDRETIIVRRALVNPNEKKNEFWTKNPHFAQWLLAVSGLLYKWNFSNALRALLRLNAKRDSSKVVCSELVAIALKNIGVLERSSEGGMKSNNYVPRDFSSSESLSGKDIKLKNDCYFEPEVCLLPTSE